MKEDDVGAPYTQLELDHWNTRGDDADVTTSVTYITVKVVDLLDSTRHAEILAYLKSRVKRNLYHLHSIVTNLLMFSYLCRYRSLNKENYTHSIAHTKYYTVIKKILY